MLCLRTVRVLVNSFKEMWKSRKTKCGNLRGGMCCSASKVVTPPGVVGLDLDGQMFVNNTSKTRSWEAGYDSDCLCLSFEVLHKLLCRSLTEVTAVLLCVLARMMTQSWIGSVAWCFTALATTVGLTRLWHSSSAPTAKSVVLHCSSRVYVAFAVTLCNISVKCWDIVRPLSVWDLGCVKVSMLSSARQHFWPDRMLFLSLTVVAVQLGSYHINHWSMALPFILFSIYM